MFITRASSDVQHRSPRIYFHRLFMVSVFLISALSYHIHNPFMLLGNDEECRNSFAGVIYEDINGDGALGLREETLPGFINLRSQFGAMIRKFETNDGYFITTEILCGTYDVLYQFDTLDPEELVGEIEVGAAMNPEVYQFIGTRPEDELHGTSVYTLYLPYIAR